MPRSINYLIGGQISPNDKFLIVNGHHFYCDQLLDLANQCPQKPNINDFHDTNTITKTLTTRIKDQNQQPHNLAYRCEFTYVPEDHRFPVQPTCIKTVI